MPHQRFSLISFFVAMCLCGKLLAQPTVVIRVDPRCGNDANSGSLSDWSDAVASLHRAAQLATSARATGADPEIRLAATPTHLTILNFPPVTDPRTAEIVIPAGTKVLGGFGGCSSLSPDDLESATSSSTVSGLLTGVGSPNPAFRLFLVPPGGSGTSVFSRLVLTNAIGSCSTCEGAGVTAFSGDLQILSCRFEGLEAEVRGGGLLYVNSLGNLLIDAVEQNSPRSVFLGCKATSDSGLGGGAFVDAQFMRINRARFEQCGADLRGGGMFALVSTTEIGAERDVLGFETAETSFQANGQTQQGAGLYLAATTSARIVGTHFGKNEAGNLAGGAFVASPSIVIRRSMFEGGQAAPAVGGCVLSTSEVEGTIEVSLTRFTGQSAGRSAGALETRNGIVKLSHCSFRASAIAESGSAATWHADGATSVEAINCLFAAEYAGESAVSSVQLTNSGNALFTNCTFAANQDSLGATWALSRVSQNPSSAQTVIVNSIVWGYFDDSIVPPDSTVNPFLFDSNSAPPLVGFSNIQGALFVGSNSNISQNPVFASPTGPSYRLLNTSPCIDSGSDALVSLDALDIDRDANTTERIPWDLSAADYFAPVPRLVGSPCSNLVVCPRTNVDMGAFEAFAVFCRVDWNGDGAVDVVDIFDFLNDWFMGIGDYNLDGQSTTSDIFDFLNAWFIGHCKDGPGTVVP
ncbi:MAG: hypothetical protein K2W85_17035 [Phycisphaerales bacterium]|nr:hypothetical protein [Phycisphaerales bacterium]